MIAGIALYLKAVNPNIRIVGVQSANVSPLADFKTTHMLRFAPLALTKSFAHCILFIKIHRTSCSNIS